MTASVLLIDISNALIANCSRESWKTVALRPLAEVLDLEVSNSSCSVMLSLRSPFGDCHCDAISKSDAAFGLVPGKRHLRDIWKAQNNAPTPQEIVR